MKLHKFILTGIIIILSSLSSFSQISRTVEVTVKDTVFLKTTMISYRISFEKNSLYDLDLDYLKESPYGDDDDDDDQEDPPAEPMTPEQLTMLLDRNNFTYVKKDYGNYELGEDNEETSTIVDVSLKNENDLKRLFVLLKDQTEVYGKINRIEYEAFTKYQDEVYKSLYDRAMSEVKSIAKVSGMTVDRMVSMKDRRGELDSYMQIYEEMMKNMPFGDKNVNDYSGKYLVIEKIITFEVK